MERLDPSALLGRLEIAAGADSELSGWLAEGLNRWLEKGGELDLGRCLGIDPVKLRRDRRNEYIRQAGLIVGSAEELATFINRFENQIWPIWRERNHLPDSAINQNLLLARKTGLSLPTSPKQLKRILGQK